MSACDNCPCHTSDDYGSEYCELDLDIFDAYNPPDSCPDGDALKARRENSELVLYALGDTERNMIVHALGMMSNFTGYEAVKPIIDKFVRPDEV